jgi:hypothetical protein
MIPNNLFHAINMSLNQTMNKQLELYGNDDQEAMSVAIAWSWSNATPLTVNDSDDEVIFIDRGDGGGKHQEIRTTDHCGGRESGGMNLSQASIKSDTEVVKIHMQNINDSILKRGKWDVSEHKGYATLTKNLTKDIHSPVHSTKPE